MPAGIPWQTRTLGNDYGSWRESRYLENGLRCCRAGRSYFAVDRGKNWRTKDYSSNAKLEFVRGAIIDVHIAKPEFRSVREILAFALGCACDPQPLGPLDEPLFRSYPKKLKHMICRMRYYEETHPEFGHLFKGARPKVSVDDLAAMIVNAHQKKTIRIPAEALRFDPRD
ncbi:MAG TPA: hypothetical protein VEB66_01575 [Opitutaceae bacterium]|nr:hypothetical protein [Opitutaceae bacterium]